MSGRVPDVWRFRGRSAGLDLESSFVRSSPQVERRTPPPSLPGWVDADRSINPTPRPSNPKPANLYR